MADQEIRIGVIGRIGEHAARMLGGRIEQAPDGFDLVVPHLDQAQVTGLLIRLDDLHIGFHRVAVVPVDPDTNRNDHHHHHHHDDHPNDNNEGARP